jgi:hypothetical protein
MDGRQGGSPRVAWARIDRALAPFAPRSLPALLSAALDSPFLGAFREQLWLVWTRAVRRPPTGTRTAGPADLTGLITAGFAADPRTALAIRKTADPRALVRYSCSGSRLRVHSGELEHPLLFLRSASMVAAAADPYLIGRIGFGLNDVIELALRVSDRTLSYLSPAWPAGEVPDWAQDDGVQIEEFITEAEVSAAERSLQAFRSAAWPSRALIPVARRWPWSGFRASRSA